MRRWLALLALLTCFTAAGCADDDRRSESSPFGGFYGGVHGGATR